MPFKFFVVLASILVVLSGCAGAPKLPASAPKYQRAPESQDGLSSVYIYRLGAYPFNDSPRILIDNRLVFEPPEKAYTVIRLSPGIHTVNTQWSWISEAPDLSFKIEVLRGKPLYLKLTGRDEVRAYSTRRVSSARVVEQSVAESEMEGLCGFMPNSYKDF